MKLNCFNRKETIRTHRALVLANILPQYKLGNVTYRCVQIRAEKLKAIDK